MGHRLFSVFFRRLNEALFHYLVLQHGLVEVLLNTTRTKDDTNGSIPSIIIWVVRLLRQLHTFSKFEDSSRDVKDVPHFHCGHVTSAAVRAVPLLIVLYCRICNMMLTCLRSNNLDSSLQGLKFWSGADCTVRIRITQAF